MDAATHIGLSLYIETFAARDDAYVKDSRVHVAEPLTPDVLYDAIVTKHAVSGYTARHTDHGIVTNVGAIDFDKAPDGSPALVQKTLTGWGIPSLISLSRRGAHLWVLSAETPASTMRRMLEQAIRVTDPAIMEGVEVFPKASDSDWGCGALRMPLMTHPKTKVRYPVFDMHGNRLTKLIDVYHHVDLVPCELIQKFAQLAPVEYPRGLGEYRKSRSEVIGDSAVSLLTSLGVERAVPGRNVKCPFHGDSHASMRIAPDDQRVWCKAPECEAFNGGRGLGTIALAKMIRGRRVT